MKTNTTVPTQETILVASANVPLITSGNLADEAALDNGELGMVSAAHGQTTGYWDFISTAGTANTVAKNPKVQLVQGTPTTQDFASLSGAPNEVPPFVISHVLDGNNPISMEVQAAAAPRNSAWVLTGVSALDERSYQLHVGFTGVRNNREFSISGIEMLSVEYTTPDYSTAGYTDDLDHLLQTFAYKVNLNSSAFNVASPAVARGNKDVVCLGINVSGGGADPDLSTFSVGGTIPVMSVGGTTYSIPVTDGVKSAIDAAVANSTLANTSEVVPIDPATAGSAADVDALLFISLDKDKAIVTDKEFSVKTRLHVGVEYNFNSPSLSLTEVSTSYEGQGQGSHWKLIWEDRAGLNIYTQQNRPMGEEYIIPVEFIDETKYYNANIITNAWTETINYSHTNQFPRRVIVLTECDTNTIGTSAVGNAVGSLNSIVKVWLESGNNDGAIPDFV